MKLAKSHWSWLRRCWIPSQMWHLSLGWKSVLRRNTGECIVLIIMQSSLAVVNINHLFSLPFLAASFPFLPCLPIYLLNLLNWPVYVFLSFLVCCLFLFLWFCGLLPFVSPTCLGSVLLVFLFARSLPPFLVLHTPAAAQPGPRTQPCGLWDCGERASCCQCPCHRGERPEARFVHHCSPPSHL